MKPETTISYPRRPSLTQMRKERAERLRQDLRALKAAAAARATDNAAHAIRSGQGNLILIPIDGHPAKVVAISRDDHAELCYAHGIRRDRWLLDAEGTVWAHKMTDSGMDVYNVRALLAGAKNGDRLTFKHPENPDHAAIVGRQYMTLQRRTARTVAP